MGVKHHTSQLQLFISKVARTVSNQGLTETEHLPLIKALEIRRVISAYKVALVLSLFPFPRPMSLPLSCGFK